jgi:hypothetical protein
VKDVRVLTSILFVSDKRGLFGGQEALSKPASSWLSNNQWKLVDGKTSCEGKGEHGFYISCAEELIKPVLDFVRSFLNESGGAICKILVVLVGQKHSKRCAV